MSLVGKAGYKETAIGWIPQDWTPTTLANCATITMGQSPAGDTYNTNGVGKPLLNGPTEFTDRYPVKIQWTTSPTKLCKSGDILICVRGSSTGRMNIANDEYCIGRGLASIRYKPGYSQDYLIHLLNHSVSKILKSAVGSTFPSIDGKAISSISVPTPTLPEQQKIAAILTTVDDKLDVIARQIEATQTLKQGLMQTLFSRGVGAQDADDRWVPHAEFKESELGEIPAGWEIVPQGAVTTFFNGRAYKLTEWEESGTPVIRLQNLTGSGDKYYYSNLALPEHQYVHKGDLLYMWSATFGPYIWWGEKAIFHYHIWKVECGEQLDKRFMYYSLVWLTAAMKGKTHGSTMMHLTKAGMEKYPMVLPPLGEQRRIAAVLSGVDSKIELLRARQTQLQSLKRGLMQKLLTGEWRVNVDASASAT